MGSKLMFFDKVLENLDPKKIGSVLTVFWRFLHGSGSGFFADPDPDSGKKSDPDPDSEKRPIRIRKKGPGSETLYLLYRKSGSRRQMLKNL